MAINLNRILFCTDFSDDADNALLTALDIGEKYQARLYVLHVMHSVYQSMPPNRKESGRGGIETIISPELVEKGTEKLKERYEAKIGALRTNCEYHVIWGVPLVEIVRFARVQNVNIIVLGAAGSSNVKRITFGSTAENVARRAHCSVMIIRKPENAF